MKRKLAIVALLGGAIALGALREFLFLNLNYQLDHVQRATEFSYAHSIFQGWTQHWSLSGLITFKWSLAVGFIVIMTCLGVLLARLLFGHMGYARPMAIAVVTVAGCALLLNSLAGWLPPLADVSVKLLHMLQYPVVMLVLLAGKALGR